MSKNMIHISVLVILGLLATAFLGCSNNGGRFVPTTSSEEALALVEEGWDLLKIHPGLTWPEYEAMAASARREGIEFGGHVPAEVGLERAIAEGQLTFDHIDGYVEYLYGVNPDSVDEEALRTIIEQTREAGAWEVLYGTSDLETLKAYPELQYMPRNVVASWVRQFEQRVASPDYDIAAATRWIDVRMQVLGALNDAGAGILMGTDAPQQFSVPGFSLHREMARMVDAGMTPYQVLRSGTVAVGTYFSAWDAFGTVAPGQRADLILLRANPLADVANVANPAGVMVAGRWFSGDRISERLAAISASYRD